MTPRKVSPATTWIRRALVGMGVVMLAYAFAGVLGSRDVRLPYLRFLVLAPAIHELILMPSAIAIGVLIGRFVPVAVRSTVQAALFISVVITVVALPAVLGYGRAADLPSALPRNYGRGLIIILAAVWCVALGTVVTKQLRRRQTIPKGQS